MAVRFDVRPLMAAACLASACGRAPATVGDSSRLEHHGPVVLITIDTLRADRLGVYGSTRGLTPNIDRLAGDSANAVVFEAAVAQVPLTLPSHATILTGLHPARHRVRTNDGFRLAADVPTLPAALQDAGYATGAFVGGDPVNSATGIARGFAHFDDAFLARGANERRAADVVAAALPWIREQAQRDSSGRLFVWIHLFDPHSPYEAPPEFARSHPDAPYDAEVAYTDAAVGTLLDALAAARLLDRALVIVVGDHGESLGEHGERTHGTFVYDATIHVPMIVRLPPAGRPSATGTHRVAVPVETADLAPTIAALAGVTFAGTDGLDLRPLLSDGATSAKTAPGARRVVYAESYYQQVLLGWSPLRAVRAPDWKFIEAPRPELYDLAADPGETTNAIERRAGVAQAMAALLPSAAAAVSGGSSTDAAARLRSLGYASGRTEPAAASGADPKDKIAVWNAIEAGIDALPRDAAAARAAFARALQLDPGNALILKYQGDTSFREGRLAEAAAAYRRAIDGGFRHPDAFINLASIAERRGRADEARAALNEAVARAPDDADAWNRLGRLELEHGAVDAARHAFERSAAVAPARAEPHFNLGVLERGAGNARAAEDHFRQAITRDPQYADAHYELGTTLLASDRATEALNEYAAALAVRADYPEALFGAARAELELRRWEDARRHYERFVQVAPRAYGAQVAAAKDAIRRLAQR